MAKLYGIGVGPGDPELFTIKGKRLINEVDVLFCPVKKEGGESFAFEIIHTHLENKRVELVDLVYPMHYKEDELKTMWERNGELINGILTGDKSGAFITLGDPTVFSTFMYTLPHIDRTKIDVEVIPGITSFCAVASSLQLPLVEWEEKLTIMPVRRRTAEELGTLVDASDNLVLMKPSDEQGEIVRMLKEKGLEKNFVLISRAGTEEENIITDIATLESNKIPYLSTMVVKKKGI